MILFFEDLLGIKQQLIVAKLFEQMVILKKVIVDDEPVGPVIVLADDVWVGQERIRAQSFAKGNFAIKHQLEHENEFYGFVLVGATQLDDSCLPIP